MTAPPLDDRRSHIDLTALLVLLVCCAIWGLGQSAIKVAIPEVPPLLQSGVRSVGATLLLLLWMRWRRLPLAFADGSLRGGLLAGLLFAAEFGCIFVGMQFTTASRMAVFVYLAPFVVALGMPLIARNERLSAVQVAGLVMAFAGVVWAFAEGLQADSAKSGPLQWVGDALGIAAALMWGATTLTLRATALRRATPEMTLLYQLAVSGLVLGGAGLLAGERWPAAPSTTALASLLFQTVVVSFASFLAWFWLVRHYPATRISAFTLLTPIFGLLAGVALLGEPLTVRLLVALTAVCGGIALVNRAPR